MTGRSLRVRAAGAAVSFVLCGCGSTVQVVPDCGTPSAPTPDAPASPPPVARPDPFAPRVTPFHPPADDILRDLAAWDAATSAQRRERAEALAARLPGFALKEMKTFECGAQRHEVAIFLREPVMTGDDMELVLLPCGPPVNPGAPIKASNDAPEERIAADAPFLIARTEVSNSDWICGSGRDIEEFDPAPVGGVSYTEALEFCVRAGLDLPSSAQWDFACRAGATTRYFFGDDASRLPEFAWTAENSGGHAHPPAEKLPNAFGLFDVYGNLREWCRDGQARHVCPHVSGQGFDGGLEPCFGHGRAHFASKHANVGFRPVYVIPDEKAWDSWPHREVRHVSAKGARRYRLENGPDGKPAWIPRASEARLFDDGQRLVGRVCSCPCSLAFEIGAERLTANALRAWPSQYAGTIPELQLIVQPVASSGVFARVTFVEQLRTRGGAAPAVVPGDKIGDEIDVPVTADYVFADTIGM